MTGDECATAGGCTDGVWPGKTHIAIGQDQGCGATSSSAPAARSAAA